MYEFTYHGARALDEATALLAENGDAKPIAGGQSLLPMMKFRLASPSDLVDLNKIAGLNGIAMEGDLLAIGAMARHAEVHVSPVVQQAIPALAALAGLIGDPAVRHRGTLGGSLANNDPNADYPAAALALGATIVTTKREIAADDFFAGLFETVLEPDELITKARFPVPQKAAYQKFRNPASRYAIVGVFVATFSDGVRVAVTGAGTSGAFRLPEFEAALTGRFEPAALEGISVPEDGLASDIHASAEYRAHLIGVMARRAVAAANG
ncbi:carbon monoxide dehydrogenase [Rhodoplanes elegans]|uniref:Carbon monoxide dehydrogenase n=1 Tax=Rhodoplanes elegans TaxID=29408 RepID=A0A327KGZ4_9BRAD|nr:xanthine dehydrogenase family protein subunit M [Rhodoplanes elegans]MBK5959178.1 carbon monoxide dehydrogenase [Rhodoplanes elegans]RAI36903.1 carbon monoxide dehydrogenase [Rhodoplanes elegans]